MEMIILNAGIAHNSNDWLMCLTIKIEKIKKELSLENICRFNSN
jgi:hypothetical protein